MKTHNFIRLILYFTLGLTMTSCSVDDVTIEDTIIKVSFANQTQIMTQEMESIAIPLKLNSKAVTNGYVSIELSGNAIYDTDYTTVPPSVDHKLTINFLANTAQFYLVINRSNPLTTEKTINLKLSHPSTGFSLGSAITSEVVLNAETSSINKLNFDTSAGFVCEDDSEGLIIGLNTTVMTSNGSSAKIKLSIPQGIIYGTHFYTIPSAVLDEISLEFDQNTHGASFKLIPVNDNVIIGDYTTTFEIIETSTNLVIGENKIFSATITENDQPSGTTNTIADLRSKFNEHQGDWYLSTDYYIEGVITSNGNTIDHKSVYIQDATSGILIRFNTPNIFDLGDKIRLNLVNGRGISINSQKSIDGVSINGFVKYAENITVQAETITISQLLSGNYEGKRVKVENVSFINADSTTSFLGTHTIKNDNDVATVVTYETAPFSNEILPQGSISISGIVGDYGRLMPQKFSHDIIRN